MSQIQYLKILERELQKINKIIDQKIIRGQDYVREARDHKLILKKIHYHTKKSRGLIYFFRKFFTIPSFQF